MLRHHGYRDSSPIDESNQKKKRKPTPVSHKIHLLVVDDHGGKGWVWVYKVNGVEKARSPKVYSNLGVLSQRAYAFRELLKNADLCSVEPPPDHKYSGG